MGGIGYAIEIQDYPLHWYMNEIPKEGKPEYFDEARYYYLLINFTLLVFVAFVGISHLGLFKTASNISIGIKKAYESGNQKSI